MFENNFQKTPEQRARWRQGPLRVNIDYSRPAATAAERARRKVVAIQNPRSIDYGGRFAQRHTGRTFDAIRSKLSESERTQLAAARFEQQQAEKELATVSNEPENGIAYGNQFTSRYETVEDRKQRVAAARGEQESDTEGSLLDGFRDAPVDEALVAEEGDEAAEEAERETQANGG